MKSISYAGNMHASRIAKDRGGDEALLVTPDGVVLEAPTSSVFFADESGALHTPGLETGILDSITRAKLLGAIEVTEGTYRVADVLGASEAFLASTTREVQAISRIDDVELAGPGPRTREAQAAFSAVVERELGG